MPNISVRVASTNGVNVQVQDPNNLKVVVQNPAAINAVVTPLPNNVISLNRGIVGPPGPSGESNIGGYPIAITGAQNYDALMWLDGEWVNVPQAEITDGGNF
jgi:hypothetical protein